MIKLSALTLVSSAESAWQCQNLTRIESLKEDPTVNLKSFCLRCSVGRKFPQKLEMNMGTE